MRRERLSQAKRRSIFHRRLYLRSFLRSCTRLLSVPPRRFGAMRSMPRSRASRSLSAPPSQALSAINRGGSFRTKAASRVRSVSTLSNRFPPSICRASGRPLRSATAMILVAFPARQIPTHAPLFSRERRSRRYTPPHFQRRHAVRDHDATPPVLSASHRTPPNVETDGGTSTQVGSATACRPTARRCEVSTKPR